MWHTAIITAIPYRPIHPFLLGAGFLGLILAILIWALPIILIVAILDWIFTPRQTLEDYNSLRILRERFARGEIDKQEFEDRKRHLQ